MIENYRKAPFYALTGSVLALNLTGTAATTAGTVSEGIYHVSNSSSCHFSFDTAYKIQTIAVTPTEAVTYTLTVGAVVLTTNPLDATPTLAELVTELQADGDYAAAPFTVAANATGITVTWKALGTQADNAVMTDDVPSVFTTVTVEAGGAVADATCGLFAIGERYIVIPDGVYVSVVKSAGAADGVIRLTLCE